MELDSMSPALTDAIETTPQERRRGDFDTKEWWQRLSMDQKFGVYQLSKFGFELAFIRNMANGPIAVVRRSREYATVDQSGEVNLNPTLQIRD
ncbi:hypothetical protein [Pseudidiomarina homiensis]|uniref:Uncharacterized protein n=2 Tax=Pseudidiomarina homiensis TaxID=364198 RepID=A0A432Y700_9GAMM|nr:hypothetical protein [Pseudidiomarina homiensis]RUO56717.1 hypothetical protein CWI70_08295 [Pseudidiomarina homiensis]